MTTNQNYRKVTDQELINMGYKLPDKSTYAKHRAFVRKYYPSDAYTVQIVFDSEYNDCTYNNTFRYVIVYDKNGNELPPLKETAQECRNRWDVFDDVSSYETEGPIDPVTISMLESLPDLYIKE